MDKYIKYYHISPSSNHESILKNGLHESKTGLDGSGLYLWKGSLIDALWNAGDSLLDNHYNDKDYDFSGLDLWEVVLPDSTTDTAGFPEYGCFQLNGKSVSATFIGDFKELYNKY